MLIINGTAELMQDNQEFTQGARHEFNMFSKETPFENQLSEIEEYLVSRGWDNIEILSNGVIDSAEQITHTVMVQAYEKAKDEGFSVTFNTQPLS